MRQFAAIVLFLPLGALFTGAMRLSSVCAPEVSCSSARHAGACHKPDCDDCQRHKPEKKGDRPARCFDCPLCAPVTLSSFIRFDHAQPDPRPDYAVIPVDNLSDYYQHHWKPPDQTGTS